MADRWLSETKYYTPRPGARTRPEAQEIATRNRGTKPDWFQHEPNRPAENTPPKTRLKSQDALHNKERVKGPADEKWFKVEDNRQYFSPRPKSRLQTPAAEKYKLKTVGAAVNWFKHDDNKNYHSPRNEPKKRMPQYTGAEDRSHLRNSAATWFRHNGGSSTPRPVTAPKTGLERKTESNWEKKWSGPGGTPRPQSRCHSGRKSGRSMDVQPPLTDTQEDRLMAPVLQTTAITRHEHAARSNYLFKSVNKGNASTS